jgi:hypothetical protein
LNAIAAPFAKEAAHGLFEWIQHGFWIGIHKPLGPHDAVMVANWAGDDNGAMTADRVLHSIVRPTIFLETHTLTHADALDAAATDFNSSPT